MLTKRRGSVVLFPWSGGWHDRRRIPAVRVV
jgi:hypothetical protein